LAKKAVAADKIAEVGDAKTRMLIVAERLFAQGGFSGVSLREIASAAGQRNHFAVQYHFGSRDGLIQAIFDHRMGQMEPIRGRMLAAARAGDGLDDLRTLVEIIYLPQLELPDDDGRHSYAGFLSQYLLRARSRRFGEFSSATPPELAMTLALLRERLGHLSEAAAQRRLISASFMFVHILVHHGDREWAEAGNEPFSAAVVDTLDQIVRCLEAPIAAD